MLGNNDVYLAEVLQDCKEDIDLDKVYRLCFGHEPEHIVCLKYSEVSQFIRKCIKLYKLRIKKISDNLRTELTENNFDLLEEHFELSIVEEDSKGLKLTDRIIKQIEDVFKKYEVKIFNLSKGLNKKSLDKLVQLLENIFVEEGECAERISMIVRNYQDKYIIKKENYYINDDLENFLDSLEARRESWFY